MAQRRQADTGYKATRPDETPPPITALADVKRGQDRCSIPWLELDDAEADDVIATLVAVSPHRSSVIMSGDKDFYQLLDEHVHILNTTRKTGNQQITCDEIVVRYGVHKTAARLLTGGLAIEDLPSDV